MKTVIRLQHVPPSTNNLFVNVRGRGRVKSERYRTWLKAVEYDMLPHQKLRYTVPVNLFLIIGELRANADVSNRIKPLEDLLVSYGILPDDNCTWIKSVLAGVSKRPFKGAAIYIAPFEGWPVSWAHLDPDDPSLTNTREAA